MNMDDLAHLLFGVFSVALNTSPCGLKSPQSVFVALRIVDFSLQDPVHFHGGFKLFAEKHLLFGHGSIPCLHLLAIAVHCSEVDPQAGAFDYEPVYLFL